jgi:hypothetical protein
VAVKETLQAVAREML